MSRRARAGAVVIVAALVGACRVGGDRPIETRTYTDTYAMRVSWDPMPAYAREQILFKVNIRDKKTGEPIEAGEGQVFATNSSGVNVYDSFIQSPESGTYTAKLRFVTAGEWALGIRFRKDSLSKLERPFGDIRLAVRNER